jgi:hypothetical protein
VTLASLGAALATTATFSATGQAQELSPCPDGLPAAHQLLRRTRRPRRLLLGRQAPERWNGVLVLHAHGGPRLGPPQPSSPIQDLTRFSVISAKHRQL